MESVCVVWVCKHELLQTVGNRAAEEMAHRMTWTPLIHLWYLHLLFRCGEFYTQNWSSQIAPTCVVSRSVTITPFLPRCCYWFPSRWGGSGWAAFCPPVCPDLLQSRSPAGSGPCNQEEQKEMVTIHFSEHKLTTCSWEIVDVDSSLKALWSTFNVPEMNSVVKHLYHDTFQRILVAQLPGGSSSSKIKHQHCQRKQEASWAGQRTLTKDNADKILHFSYCQ